VGINRRRPGGGVDPRGPSAPERRVRRGSGRPFSLLKFRTMYADARARFPELYAYQYSREELETLPIKVLVSTKLADRDEDGNVYFETGLPTDPRVTRMGAWLRRSSLDELPNFWNVLIGDMDIVGPRPDIEENFAYYAPPHRAKVDVKPGITGLAQIQGRGMLTFHQINEYDMQYVQERCVKLDLIIFCKTIVAWFTRRGAF
jgi:lipopolysaccharide/colanic/teichoic acid biosynthesis glycosyltransferase